MILGRFEHSSAACFDEVAAAVKALTDRPVYFNAHRYPVPPGAIVYNMEDARLIPNPAERWAGHEVWDTCKTFADTYGAKYVPIGYHPSMESFAPVAEPDIDIAFAGLVTPRRGKILQALQDRGLVVVVAPVPSYGQRRNSLYARAKLVMDILSFDDGSFSSVRAAVAVANRIPILSERAPESWDFIPSYGYEKLVDMAAMLVGMAPEARAARAQRSYDAFKSRPMELPA